MTSVSKKSSVDHQSELEKEVVSDGIGGREEETVGGVARRYSVKRILKDFAKIHRKTPVPEYLKNAFFVEQIWCLLPNLSHDTFKG